MIGLNLRKFWIVFGVGALVGGFSALAFQPQSLTASQDNINGRKFEALVRRVEDLSLTMESQSDLLSGFSRDTDGSLRIADKTTMIELLVDCPADADTQSPGLTVCGPAVFESSRADAARVVFNGNDDFDPAILVSIPDLPMPRSAIGTLGGDVSFVNSRVRIVADDAGLDGNDPLLLVSTDHWSTLSDSPLLSVRGGNLNVAGAPDQGQVTIAPGDINAISPSGSRAFIEAGHGFSKIELLVIPNVGGPVVSRTVLQANGGDSPRSSLSADDVTADYIFGRDIVGFDITEINATDGW